MIEMGAQQLLSLGGIYYSSTKSKKLVSDFADWAQIVPKVRRTPLENSLEQIT